MQAPTSLVVISVEREAVIDAHGPHHGHFHPKTEAGAVFDVAEVEIIGRFPHPAGIDEADLAPLLNQVVSRHPSVDIGSYPAWADPKYNTKLTFDGKDGDAITRAVDEFLGLLPDGEPQWTE